jgi:uncharacterized protein (DUF2141 family)
LRKKEKQMKKLSIPILLVIGLLATSNLFAQRTLEVTVKNIKERKGTVRVALYNNEKDFLENFLQGKIVKVAGNEAKIVFENLKPGDYAVSVFHDENENEKLDSGFMGIPNEPYGFSNDAMGTFGPPSFEKAKMSLTSDKASVITLH